MSLLEDARRAVRVTSEMTDSEIQMWLDAAFADMARCGVKADLIDPSDPSPLAKAAAICYVKCHYGFDNSEAPRFLQSYKSILANLLNSKANEYLEG